MSDITGRLTEIEDVIVALVDELVADKPTDDLLNAIGLGVRPEHLKALRDGMKAGNATYVWRKRLSIAVTQLVTVQVADAARCVGGYGLPLRRKANRATPVNQDVPGDSAAPGTGPDLLPLLPTGGG